MEGIGHVFDHFRHSERRLENPGGHPAIEFAQQPENIRLSCSQNRVRGFEKILDGASFAHEFRIIANAEVNPGPSAAGGLEGGDDDGFGSARQDRAADYHQVVGALLPESASDFATRVLDVAEVQFRVALARSPTETKDKSVSQTAEAESAVARSRP